MKVMKESAKTYQGKMQQQGKLDSGKNVKNAWKRDVTCCFEIE